MSRASIQLFDEDGATSFVARRGLSDAYVHTIETRWRSTFDASHPTTFVSNDIEQDAARESLWREVLAEGIRSLVSIPLIAQSRLLGKFVIYDSKDGTPPGDIPVDPAASPDPNMVAGLAEFLAQADRAQPGLVAERAVEHAQPAHVLLAGGLGRGRDH